jgi:hypothetical protein
VALFIAELTLLNILRSLYPTRLVTTATLGHDIMVSEVGWPVFAYSAYGQSVNGVVYSGVAGVERC